MNIDVTFPGGRRVDARVGSHVIRTDQPEAQGGTGSAATPFDLFMASLATCAGFYALRFCQQRDIDTAGLGVKLEAARDEATKRFSRVLLRVELPPEFPDKYRSALVRAIDHCAVKRHVVDPPDFDVQTVRPESKTSVAPSPAASEISNQ